MPRGRVLTEETKKKIQKLIIVGLSDTEIGAALKISSDVVHKLRKNKDVKKDVGEPENHHGSKQKTGKRRPRDTDSHKPSEDQQPVVDHIENTVPAGEKKLIFTGGKKHKGGKTDMSKDGKEDFEFECPKCHHQFNGSPDKCPKCNAELQE